MSERAYKSNLRKMNEERARLSLEVLAQQNKEWEMDMDREFPNWRGARIKDERWCEFCLGWGVKLSKFEHEPLPVTRMEIEDDLNNKGKVFAPCPKCGSSKDRPVNKDRDWV